MMGSRTSLAVPDLAIAPPESTGPDFLRAATELINAEGYRGASVSKIAARLNVTKGAFYYHRETKDELVEECFELTWDILRKAQSAADAATETGLTNLLAQAQAMVAGQVTNERPLLRTSALAAVPEAMRPKLLAGFERITARYASVVSDGVADGSIRPLDVPLAAQMISGAINAAAELRFWAPGLTPAKARAGYVLPLFAGLFSESR
jgi:AcrR family transcriptional regulator